MCGSVPKALLFLTDDAETACEKVALLDTIVEKLLNYTSGQREAADRAAADPTVHQVAM